MKDKIITFLKGIWIGGTMTVPGISGGTMAMVLNIYDRIIDAVASFRKNVKSNAIYLLILGFGGLMGFILFARYILQPLLVAFALQTQFFFIGAVAGGGPTIFKSSGAKRATFKNVLSVICGAIAVLLIDCIPDGLFVPTGAMTFAEISVQFLGGLLVSIAFVLPGISVSQMLLMLGIYEEIIAVASNFQFYKFIPLGIGVIVGTIIVAKTMQHLIDKHHTVTYMVIFGFLLGSIPQLLPSVFPVGFQIPICILTFAAGFGFIFSLPYLENKLNKNKQ